jgi:dihydroorotate dehydrogenase (NAD+) catalytic subunit
MRLEVRIGPLRLRNPVLVASGTAGYGEELSQFLELSELGAFVLKGVSLRPWAGNPPPRVLQVQGGLLNSIGLQNVGLRVLLEEKLPWLRKRYPRLPLVANVLGTEVAEYRELAQALDGEVEAVELNLSCPNVRRGGLAFSQDRRAFARVIREVRKALRQSLLIVKLSPVSSVREFAPLAEASGAQALSLINTIPAMAVDVKRRRPYFPRVLAGLSGPAIKPIAVRMLYEARRATGLPLIGMGGIRSAQDALEFLLAGATAVAIGTALFSDPTTPRKVLQGIKEFLKEEGLKDIGEIIGALRV